MLACGASVAWLSVSWGMMRTTLILADAAGVSDLELLLRSKGSLMTASRAGRASATLACISHTGHGLRRVRSVRSARRRPKSVAIATVEAFDAAGGPWPVREMQARRSSFRTRSPRGGARIAAAAALVVLVLCLIGWGAGFAWFAGVAAEPTADGNRATDAIVSRVPPAKSRIKAVRTNRTAPGGYFRGFAGAYPQKT